MKTNPALLQTILAKPNEDAPRLIYADWLEEQGGESEVARAEFIRVQCDLARLRYDDDLCSDLRAREYRLLSKYHSEWKEGFRNLLFRRGFLEKYLPDTPEDFLEESPELFAKNPIQDLTLKFETEPGWGESVATSPLLQRVTTLRLVYSSMEDGLTIEDFVAVVSSKHLTNLETLDASGGHDFRNDGILEILGTRGRSEPIRSGNGMLPSLKQLRKLSLNYMGLSDRGVKALVKSPLAKQLTHLDISENDLTMVGIRALVESKLWERLEELNVSDLNLTAFGQVGQLLIEALPWSRIRKLGIGRFADPLVGNSDPMVLALAESPSWGQLEAISFQSSGLGGEGVRRLAANPNLQQIRCLDLHYSDLDESGMETLSNCEHLARLTALSVKSCELPASGLNIMAESKWLKNLVVLDTTNEHMTDEGVELFAHSSNASKLQFWTLADIVGSRSITAIANSPCLDRLNYLSFGWLSDLPEKPPLGDTDALAIVQTERLPNLAFLDARWSSLTRKGGLALLDCERLGWVGWSEQLFGENVELGTQYQARFGDLTEDDFCHLPSYPREMFPWSYWGS